MSDEDQDGSMRITLRDVYNAVHEVGERLGGMETQVRLSNAHAETADARTADHETRLRALERRIWAFPSAAGLIGGIGLTLEVIRWVGK